MSGTKLGGVQANMLLLALSLLGLLSLAFIVNMMKAPDNDYRAVDVRGASFNAEEQDKARQARAALSSAKDDTPPMSMEYLQRLRVPFAPVDPKAPEPPVSAPEAAWPTTPPEGPPAPPGKRPFNKPKLKPTASQAGTGQATSAAFVPAGKPVTSQTAKPSGSSSSSNSSSSSDPNRNWRTPTGHSSVRP